jgi:hypothetical protein
VVGISAVVYSMSGTEEIKKIDKKIGQPCIKQPEMVHALKEKLEKLLNFTLVDGKYKTEFKNFENVDEKNFLTELANVKLQLMYADMLFAVTATFTLAREWKVHGKPFRTTWSTGWYVTHLPVPATTVISALLTPSTSSHKGTSAI